MNKIERANQEVTDNYNFFKTKVAELRKDHFKEYALLHEKQLIEFYDSEDDAIKIGMKDYGEGLFSVQQVDDSIIGLGFQSNVLV